MTATDAAVQERQRKLDFFAGGWVLLLAGLLCLFVIGQWGYRIMTAPQAIGDGRHVETYQFDLSTTLVPRGQILAAGMPKDGLAAMVDPNVFTPAEAAEYSRRLRKSHEGKFLVDTDRVIGVERNGEFRAYPLRIITWHEIVNDTLGGEPIAVTYNPLCDSTVVFKRRVGGQLREFGVSGLVYNSNLLMYDRQDDPNQESLWCQLQFRAVAGPAAEERLALEVLPAVVTHWATWRDAHPETTIIQPDAEQFKLYKRSYDPYFRSNRLQFTVQPVPPAGGPALKDRVIALRTSEDWRMLTLDEVAANAGDTGSWQTEIDGVPIELDVLQDPVVAVPSWPQDADVDVAYSFYFAWYAHRNAAAN